MSLICYILIRLLLFLEKDSKKNTKASRSLNDIRVASNDNLKQFWVKKIEKLWKAYINLKPVTNGPNLDNTLNAQPAIYVFLKVI